MVKLCNKKQSSILIEVEENRCALVKCKSKSSESSSNAISNNFEYLMVLKLKVQKKGKYVVGAEVKGLAQETSKRADSGPR